MPCHSAAGEEPCWAVPKRDKSSHNAGGFVFSQAGLYSHQYLLGTGTCREQQSICCSWLKEKQRAGHASKLNPCMNWHLFIDLESIDIYSKFTELGKENIPCFLSARAVSVSRKPIQSQASFAKVFFTVSWVLCLTAVLCPVQSSKSKSCVLFTLRGPLCPSQWGGSSVGGGTLPPGTGAAILGAAATE